MYRNENELKNRKQRWWGDLRKGYHTRFKSSNTITENMVWSDEPYPKKLKTVGSQEELNNIVKNYLHLLKEDHKERTDYGAPIYNYKAFITVYIDNKKIIDDRYDLLQIPKKERLSVLEETINDIYVLTKYCYLKGVFYGTGWDNFDMYREKLQDLAIEVYFKSDI